MSTRTNQSTLPLPPQETTTTKTVESAVKMLIFLQLCIYTDIVYREVVVIRKNNVRMVVLCNKTRSNDQAHLSQYTISLDRSSKWKSEKNLIGPFHRKDSSGSLL